MRLIPSVEINRAGPQTTLKILAYKIQIPKWTESDRMAGHLLSRFLHPLEEGWLSGQESCYNLSNLQSPLRAPPSPEGHEW